MNIKSNIELFHRLINNEYYNNIELEINVIKN